MMLFLVYILKNLEIEARIPLNHSSSAKLAHKTTSREECITILLLFMYVRCMYVGVKHCGSDFLDNLSIPQGFDIVHYSLNVILREFMALTVRSVLQRQNTV